MRITCVIGPFLPIPPLLGGAVEKIFLTLCKEFARQGHSVTIISRCYQDLPRAEVADNITYLRVASRDAPRSKILYRIYDVVYALRVCFMIPDADIIITHSVFLPLIIWRRKAGIVYVSVARFPKNQFWLYRRVGRLQAVSSHVQRAICNQSPAVAHLTKTIPNCINYAFTEAIVSDRGLRRKEIIFVGRLAREKGVELLIRAYRAIHTVYPEWRLVIVGPHQTAYGGDGEDYLDELKQLCDSASDAIEFAGPIFSESRLIAKLKSADIFVYPSIAARGEALPLAPLEAMACGCAVLVSALECYSDYLRPGINGLQFDHLDLSGEDLIQRILELLKFPELRESLGLEALRTSRDFTPTRIANEFLSDFSCLLGLEGSARVPTCSTK